LLIGAPPCHATINAGFYRAPATAVKSDRLLGAASGIGKSSAEALAGLGARVLCADRNEATAAGIREAGSWAEAITTDGALAADVTTLAAAAKSKFPRLDIAVATPRLNIRKTILRLHRGGP
jgi:NADP-dependent 3-hydroxy acid dehydrogenase YdfG